MPVTSLTIGPVHTLVQDVIYALPARKALLYAQPFTNLLISNDGANFVVAVADTAGRLTIGNAGFIKDTVGGAFVRLSV